MLSISIWWIFRELFLKIRQRETKIEIPIYWLNVRKMNLSRRSSFSSPNQGSSLPHHARGKWNSLSQVHSSNVVVNPKTSNKAGAVERLPKGISKDSKYIFKENYSRCAFGGETKTFPRQLAKISANTNFLGYFGGSKIWLSNTPSRNCSPSPVKMKENEKSIALK